MQKHTYSCVYYDIISILYTIDIYIDEGLYKHFIKAYKHVDIDFNFRHLRHKDAIPLAQSHSRFRE